MFAQTTRVGNIHDLPVKQVQRLGKAIQGCQSDLEPIRKTIRRSGASRGFLWFSERKNTGSLPAFVAIEEAYPSKQFEENLGLSCILLQPLPGKLKGPPKSSHLSKESTTRPPWR